jgi:EAL domain-containing protein (putative c-di-GMP-specific phosphodiesterase class I)
MQDPGLPLLVSDVLEDTHLSPALLTLEITEQSAVQDIRLSNNVMSELNDLGVRVAVDDFGSGYSSFYLLRELPLHTLKIDMSFVRGVPDSGRNDALLRSIVSLAHILDMDVTAEGVELQAQYDYLEAVHCDRVQGYLVSSPLPAEAVIDFLQQPVPAQRTTTSVPSFDATKALPVGTAGSLQR